MCAALAHAFCMCYSSLLRVAYSTISIIQIMYLSRICDITLYQEYKCLLAYSTAGSEIQALAMCIVEKGVPNV